VGQGSPGSDDSERNANAHRRPGRAARDGELRAHLLRALAHVEEAVRGPGVRRGLHPCAVVGDLDEGEGTRDGADYGRGLGDLLLSDAMTPMGRGQPYEKCDLRFVEWRKRQSILDEQELQHSRYGDPATRVPKGRPIDPEILIGGRIEISGDPASWTIELNRHPGGETTDRFSGRPSLDDVYGQSPAVAKERLSACARRAGPPAAADGRSRSRARRPTSRSPSC
jgi:hypothetical protein